MEGPRGPINSRRKPFWSTAMLAVVLLLLLCVTSATRDLRRCERPARFSVDGVEPLVVSRGHVTLVALLSSTCSFCIQQSRSLETLHQTLQDNGTDVHMMIVNGGPRPAPGEVGIFEQLVSFNVYHDDDSHQLWRHVFRGDKDDIFVFDRCGMLTYRLRFPYSYMGYSFVRRALTASINNAICHACPQQRDLHDVMLGDSPYAGHHFGEVHGRGRGRLDRTRGGAGYHQGRSQPGRRHGYRGGHRSVSGRNLNRSRCPRDDELCRELRRGRRRYNRFRSHHGLGQRSGMTEVEILRLFGGSGGGGGGNVMGPVA